MSTVTVCAIWGQSKTFLHTISCLPLGFHIIMRIFTSSCSFLRKLISSCSDSTLRSRSSLARAALSTSCTVTLAVNKVTSEGHVNYALHVCWHKRKGSCFTCCRKKGATVQRAKVKVTCIQRILMEAHDTFVVNADKWLYACDCLSLYSAVIYTQAIHFPIFFNPIQRQHYMTC